MKKSIKTVSLLLSLVMIFFVFTSCDRSGYGYLNILPEEIRTAKILEIIKTRLDEANSYTVSTKSIVDGMISGNGLHATAIGEEKYEGINSAHPKKMSDFAYYYDFEDDRLNYTLEVIEGYQNNQIYRKSLMDNNVIGQLTSEASKEKFQEFDELRKSDDIMLNIFDAGVSSEKSSNGSWIVNVHLIPEGKIEDVTSIEGMTDGYKVSVVDIQITIKPDFSEWKYEYMYSFEEIEGYSEYHEGVVDSYQPTAVVTSHISNIDSTTVEEVDLSSYYITSDVTMIYKVGEGIMDRLERTKGTINLTIDTTLYYQQKIEVSEFDQIVYGNNEDGFYYDIEVSSNNVNAYVKYKNGEKIFNGEKSVSTDRAEINYLYGLLTCNAYNEFAISSIRTDNKNPSKYTFMIDFNSSGLSSFTIGNVGFTSGDISVVVIMNGDEIESMETTVRLWNTYYNVSYYIVTTCQFFDEAENTEDGTTA